MGPTVRLEITSLLAMSWLVSPAARSSAIWCSRLVSAAGPLRGSGLVPDQALASPRERIGDRGTIPSGLPRRTTREAFRPQRFPERSSHCPDAAGTAPGVPPARSPSASTACQPPLATGRPGGCSPACIQASASRHSATPSRSSMRRFSSRLCLSSSTARGGRRPGPDHQAEVPQRERPVPGLSSGFADLDAGLMSGRCALEVPRVPVGHRQHPAGLGDVAQVPARLEAASARSRLSTDASKSPRNIRCHPVVWSTKRWPVTRSRRLFRGLRPGGTRQPAGRLASQRARTLHADPEIG